MAVEVLVPRLGWSMEEGTLIEWLKKDGDAVQPGDLIFVLEGDKALNEVETFESGILRIPPDSPAPGSVVPVGALLAYVVQPGEPAPFEGKAQDDKVTRIQGDKVIAGEQSVSTPPVTVSPPHLVTLSSVTPSISPRARRVAAELGVDWAKLKGSGRTGRIVERDVRAALAARPAIDATPVARRAAEELGVDLGALAARMPGQRIERADVERALTPGASPSKGEGSKTLTLGASPSKGEGGNALSPIRRVIGERMMAGSHTTAPVTLTTEVDATELVRLREQLKTDQRATGGDRPVPSYNDLMVKIVAYALQEHPALNARLEDDRIVSQPSVHIGVAVDTERGLLVGVVRDAQTKSVRQIADETGPLIARVREGKAGAAEMKGSTFTLTNLGMYEIDAFTPIINVPECAILGLGRIVAKQVVVDDEDHVAVRRMMALSLTFDHRLVDGAPAARFLQRVKHLVEQPYLWLVS